MSEALVRGAVVWRSLKCFMHFTFNMKGVAMEDKVLCVLSQNCMTLFSVTDLQLELTINNHVYPGKPSTFWVVKGRAVHTGEFIELARYNDINYAKSIMLEILTNIKSENFIYAFPVEDKVKS